MVIYLRLVLPINYLPLKRKGCATGHNLFNIKSHLLATGVVDFIA